MLVVVADFRDIALKLVDYSEKCHECAECFVSLQPSCNHRHFKDEKDGGENMV